MDKELEEIKNDVYAIKGLYELLFENNCFNNETIKILKKMLSDYCRSILGVMDGEREIKNEELKKLIDTYIRIINLLIHKNNELSKISSNYMVDISKNTEDNEIKVEVMDWCVNNYKKAKEFDEEYNKEIEKIEQIYKQAE